jgi:hypothetical protein
LYDAVLGFSKLVGMPFAEPAKDGDRRQRLLGCEPNFDERRSQAVDPSSR